MGLRRESLLSKPIKQHGLMVSSLSIFTTQSLFVLLNAIAQIILARGLGPADRGIFALATLFPLIVMELTGLGIASAVIYFIGKKRAAAEEIVGTALTAVLIWGAFITALTLLASPVLFPFAFGGVNPAYLYVSLALLPVFFASAVLNCSLLAKGALVRFGLLNNIRAVGLLLSIFVVLAASLPHLLGFFIGWIVSSLVASLATIYLTRKFFKLRLMIRWTLFKEMLSYGVRIKATEVLLYLSYRVDLLLVAGFAGPKAAGIYAVAIALTEVIWQVPGAVATALYTRVSASPASENLARMPIVTRNAIFITLLACTPFIFFGDFLIGAAFGAEFTEVVDALLILVPGVVLFGGAKMLTNYFTGSGKTGMPNIAAAACLTTMVTLDLFLIPAYGVNGAAAAASVAYALYAFIVIWAFLRHSADSPFNLLLVKASDLKMYLTLIGRVREKAGI